MLYPTVSEQQTFDVLHKYSKLHKTMKNNVINLYIQNRSNKIVSYSIIYGRVFNWNCNMNFL